MTVSCKQLAAIILLVTVLFAPLTLIAHDLKSGAMQEACACLMQQDDRPHDGTGQPDECPDNGSSDDCDQEECDHDSMESAHTSGLNIQPPPIQAFHSESARTFPQVYLAIFVPPES